MKKTAVIVIAVILIASIFAACNGSDGGKVSDTSQDLGGAMTEMATDMSEMFGGDMTDSGMNSDTNSVTDSGMNSGTVTAGNVTTA